MERIPTFSNIDYFNSKNISTFITGICIAIVIALVDYFTGREITLGLLYFIPILLVAWRCSLLYSIFMIIICTGVAIIANTVYPLNIHFDRNIIISIKIVNRVILLVFIMYLIFKVKNLIQKLTVSFREDYYNVHKNMHM